MWKIHTTTSGVLLAEEVYESGTFSDMVTALNVTQYGKTFWSKAYIPVRDVTALVPPEEK